MSMTKDQILAEARALEPAEQEQLADELWMLAHGESEQSIQSAWADEIRTRLERAKRGEGSSKPVEEVIERLAGKAFR